MKYLELGESNLGASRIVLGCMRIADKPLKNTEALLGAALESGVNMFDHADIYGGGESEKRFGEAMKNLRIDRDEIIIQSKCGIHKSSAGIAQFDFSRAHILSSVEGSLKRLGTDHLDVLLLHRPDALMDPEEVFSAFEELSRSGKVLHFGVSNFSVYQMKLLEKGRYPLIVNQLQFSLLHSGMIDEGFNVNMDKDESVQRGGDVLNYCRLKDVTVQAWSPLNYGFFEGIFVGNEKFPALNRELERLGEKYGCSPSAIAFAWILRLPMDIQAVSGTTDAGRLKDLCKGADIRLTREEWYALYLAAGKMLP